MALQPTSITSWAACDRAVYVGTNNRGLLRVSPLPPDWEFPVGSLQAAVGRITLLRVHDLNTGYGPPYDFLDAEAIVQLDSQPEKALACSCATIPTACRRRNAVPPAGLLQSQPRRADRVREDRLPHRKDHSSHRGHLGGHMPLNVNGQLSLLRVHDVGTAYGPPSDQLDVEVIVQFVGRPLRHTASSSATTATSRPDAGCSTCCETSLQPLDCLDRYDAVPGHHNSRPFVSGYGASHVVGTRSGRRSSDSVEPPAAAPHPDPVEN